MSFNQGREAAPTNTNMKGTQEQKKEKVKEIIREVFAEAGLEIKELKRGDYATLFTIEGKLII